MKDNSVYHTYRMFLYILGCSLISISFILGCSSSEEKTIETEIQPSAPVTVNKVKDHQITDLDLARMQAQIEDLKQTVQKQKETIKVLEKSLVLGISPELYIESQESIPEEDNDLDLSSNNDTDFSPQLQETTPSFDVSLEQNSKDYDTRIRYAKELYDSGSYGQAIVEYSDILKQYPKESVEVKYWIGMCWYKLKEYNLSSKILTRFINEDPGSELVPSAKLCIANSWLDQGYFDKAMKEYKTIISTYPKDPVAQTAKQQILNAGKNL